MGFTAPVTRATDFLVTAVIWNAEHVENFNTAVMHLINRKTSDQPVTSSTVLVDCTSLVLPVLANEVWQFDFNIVYDAGSTGDIKFAFTFPASGRIDANAAWLSAGVTATVLAWTGTTTPTAAASAFGTTPDRSFLPIRGIFTNSTNAGNLQLQFAQNTSDGTASTVRANSTVWGVKLA